MQGFVMVKITTNIHYSGEYIYVCMWGFSILW